ncbi:hypothetical protein JJL53_08295 [Aeromonas media]|uniref:hypothetical protein n=1 Tax=Aeromonas media TaxID=651 RepID=UPI001913B0EB|nr:hypothetical protein [Aeromonas media]QQQ15073.1 hypothetical protein JJL53_08295 [Aeromonas media]
MSQLINEKNIGDYCKVKIVSNSNLCVICFSGFNTPKGKFNYVRSFSNNEYHQIYLNTTSDDYYHKGIQGLGTNLNETISSLNKILQELPGKDIQVVTLGCSMGGYGALLYGTLMNASRILALGPSIPLYSEPFLGKAERNQHISIYKQFEDRIINSNIEKVILHGDSMISDILTHQRLKSSNNAICRHLFGCNHTLTAILASKMQLRIFVENISLALSHVETIFNTFVLPQYQYDILHNLFAPENIDGICRTPLDIDSIDDLHHTVLYCVAVSNIIRNTPMAKKCFALALEKHLHYRSAKRCLDIVLQHHERMQLLTLIERSIYSFGIEHLEMSEIVSLKKIYDELTVAVYPQERRTLVANEGYLDRHNGETLFGWCLNRNSTEAANVDVYFERNAFPRCQVVSDKFRGDLKTAGKRGGHCAFSLPLNVYEPVLINSTRAYAVEKSSNEHINNSGIPILPPFIHFYVERIVDGVIYGWVYDRNHPTNFIDISASNKINGAKVTINRFVRADMQSQGINELAGFSIQSTNNAYEPEFLEVFLKNTNLRISRAIMV